MSMRIRGLHVLVLMTAIFTVAGCQNGSKEREAKRESDRTMMRLQDADRERADLKTQVDQLKANLDTAASRSRDAQAELTAAQSRLKQAQDDLAKLQSNAAGAAEMQRKLAELQTQNEKLMADMKSLQQQLGAAKAEAAKMTPAPRSVPPTTAPSTQPTLNK